MTLLITCFAGTLLSALDDVLTTKRRLQLRVRALTAHEVAIQLSYREPVYAEHVSITEDFHLFVSVLFKKAERDKMFMW